MNPEETMSGSAIAAVETAVQQNARPEPKVQEIDVVTAHRQLMVKLQRWLMLQPEYALLFAYSRGTRRKLVQGIAKLLTTIPRRMEEEGIE